MGWTEIQSDGNLERCLELMKLSADHYYYMTTDKIKNGLERKEGHLFYYDDGTMEIILDFHWNTTKSMWRIKNASFLGGDPVTAMQKSFLKARDFIEGTGQDKAYFKIKPIKKYSKPMQEYFNQLEVIDNFKLIREGAFYSHYELWCKNI